MAEGATLGQVLDLLRLEEFEKLADLVCARLTALGQSVGDKDWKYAKNWEIRKELIKNVATRTDG